jgi:hypothetical protein
MVRIIPGVEIQVIKDIVPQQLNPSGVVGLMGTTEKGEALEPTPVCSYTEFVEKFGGSEKYTMTLEAKQAFQNGVFQVVVVSLRGKDGKNASLVLNDRSGAPALRLTARSAGEEGNKVSARVVEDEATGKPCVFITDGTNIEIYDRLSPDQGGPKDLVDRINGKSRLVTAETVIEAGQSAQNLPAPGEAYLSGGTPGVVTKADYEAALDKLEAEPDVDIVAACDVTDPEIHALIETHCARMSLDAKCRIGLGTVRKGESIKEICERTTTLASDRFVLVAPHGCLGAVAGLISKLNYFESPTFKPIGGIAKLERKYTPSEEMELLKAGILPLEEQKGRGIVIVKGITTSKEQISVVRISDRAVRSVKGISDLFIGTLNSKPGRSALRGKIDEMLTGMEREGSIVPSTDGKDPAYKLDVYSSQTDFAQGIVRVTVGVRPVRAMDYIYGTIKIES